MKLSVSSIAWSSAEEMLIADNLQKAGVKGVEIAPTKKWPKPEEATKDSIREYRTFWEDKGISIVALQALLFGQPELSVFGSSEIKIRSLDYLKKIIELGGLLGAKALVFGSPKNRLAAGRSKEDAFDVASLFFRELGDFAAQHDTCLCIEANPVGYGCDFITTSDEAAELVQNVDSAGFGLHLDTGGMIMNDENIASNIERYSKTAKHFHVSAPFLNAIYEAENVDFKKIANQLEGAGYDKWISIEMKNLNESENLEHVMSAVRVFKI